MNVLQEKLQRRNNNMDFVRYILAMSVVIAHFNTLCGGDIRWPISSASAVGGFFTMSGFLVYVSYMRYRNMKKYALSRAVRILPPYIFIVLLCASGLVTVSSLQASEYFFSWHWLKYVFSNLVFLNFLEPSLPGVFDGPEFYDSAVNGSLWTMKVEWCLYFSVPLAAWVIFKLKKVSKFAVFFSIIALSLAYKWIFWYMFDATGQEIYVILERQFFGQLAYFYVGVVIYYGLEVFLRYRYLLLGVLLILYLLQDEIPHYHMLLTPFVDGGLVMLASLMGRWGRFLSQHDNVSYDMYLFHYPILQLGVWCGLMQKWGQVPTFVFLTLVTTGLSFFSWNIIGKRFMTMKHKWLLRS